MSSTIRILAHLLLVTAIGVAGCGGDDDEDGRAEEDPLNGLDDDGDGFGDPADMTIACRVLNGYVDNSEDCNDDDSLVAVVGFFGLWWYAGKREADGRPTLGLRWIAAAVLIGVRGQPPLGLAQVRLL